MKYATHDPLAWIDERLDELDQRGLRRRLRTHAGAKGPLIRVDGRELINFGSNDYLGLSTDPRLIAAAAEAAAVEGTGAGASPLITGHSRAHHRLEQRLAQFEQTEAAMVFSSGYAANVGTISALVGHGDVIFSDQKNHASIIDGCRLTRAEVRVYPHRDWQALSALIERETAFSRRLIVTESIFSMDGDAAPLVELAHLAERNDCMLLVDEAHATGVFGRQGRGLAEELGIEQKIHARIGTLSKALGSAGGFVAGSRTLVDWLTNRARMYVFSTALPPTCCGAALAALDVVRDEPWRRETLRLCAAGLAETLRRRGVDVGESSSQIIPLRVGDADKAVAWSQRLSERGLLVPAIRHPAVPADEALLRLSLTSSHTPEMIESAIIALIS